MSDTTQVEDNTAEKGLVDTENTVTTEEPTLVEDQVEETVEPEGVDDTDNSDEVSKWKHHSRKNEEAAKQALIREKTAADALASEKAKSSSLELEVLKLKTVMEKGLGIETVALLDGTDAETITAKAETLIQLLEGGKKPANFSPNPLQGLGAEEKEAPVDNSVESLFGVALKNAQSN